MNVAADAPPNIKIMDVMNAIADIPVRVKPMSPLLIISPVFLRVNTKARITDVYIKEYVVN